MFQDFFADAIGEITLSRGMVRMDLMTVTGSSKDGAQPKLEVKQRIVMPPDGFLKSFSAMENLVSRLTMAVWSSLVMERKRAPPRKISNAKFSKAIRTPHR